MGVGGKLVSVLMVFAVVEGNSLSGYVWQLTDVHLNPWYRVGGDVWRTKCNNLSSSSSSSRAGPWGDYHCESPWRLVEAAVELLAGKKADFVIWTGDDSPMNEAYPLPSKDLHMTQQRVFDIVANLTSLLHRSNMLLLPSLGNHEVWQPSQLPAPNDSHTLQIFQTIGDTWFKYGLIPNGDELARFYAQGSFVMQPTPGLTVVSLNTLWCDLGNLAADSHLLGHVDALVFGFLADALHNASVRGDKVWITGHVPPIPSSSRQECLDAYFSLSDKYSEVIRAHFFGHTHKDHFHAFSKLANDAAPILIAPSLTPESWHEIGQNPALRRYRYNVSDFSLLGYEQFFLNLTAANENPTEDPVWELEYDSQSAYGLDDLSNIAMQKLLDNILTNSTLFQEFYLRYRSERTNTPALDAKTKRSLTCLLSSQSVVAYEACKIFT